uniref:Uncharacterized protein n=1 Tax=Oryza nivara TaxID=4536 RepID=A0A0E0H163_ORYNI
MRGGRAGEDRTNSPSTWRRRRRRRRRRLPAAALDVDGGELLDRQPYLRPPALRRLLLFLLSISPVLLLLLRLVSFARVLRSYGLRRRVSSSFAFAAWPVVHGARRRRRRFALISPRLRLHHHGLMPQKVFGLRRSHQSHGDCEHAIIVVVILRCVCSCPVSGRV